MVRAAWRAAATPVLGQWYHVAATYSNGTSRIYVNGKLEGSNYHKAAMSLMNDIGMTIGGLRGSFQFAGDIDEVRVSRVARSADWIKLEYENQKAAANPGRHLGAAGQCLFGLADGDQGCGGQERDRHRSGRRRPEGLLDSQTRWHGNHRRRGPVFVHPRCRARGGRHVVCPAVQGGVCQRGQDQEHSRDDQGRDSRTGVLPASARSLEWPGHHRSRARRSAISRRCRPKARENCITPGPSPAGP